MSIGSMNRIRAVLAHARARTSDAALLYELEHAIEELDDALVDEIRQCRRLVTVRGEPFDFTTVPMHARGWTRMLHDIREWGGTMSPDEGEAVGILS